MVKSINNSKVRKKLQRKKFNGNFINVYETPRIILGFTGSLGHHSPFQSN